jgi:hypothetical protein
MHKNTVIFKATFMLCGLLLGCSALHAATMQMVQGRATLVRDGRQLPAGLNLRMQEGDGLRTEEGGEVLIRFDDGARMALRENSNFEMSQLQLKGASNSRKKTIKVIKGSLRYISGKTTVKHKVAFVTNTSTIGIRGTDIEIVVSEEPVQDNNPGTFLKVNTGAAVLTAPDGAQVDVAPGEVAYGGEPELTARGAGGVRRAAARKVQAAGAGLFKSATLDRLMN